MEGLVRFPLDALVGEAGILPDDDFGHGAGEVGARTLVLLHQDRRGPALHHHQQAGQGEGGLGALLAVHEHHVEGGLHPDALGHDHQGAVPEPGQVQIREEVAARETAQVPGHLGGAGEVQEPHARGQAGDVAGVGGVVAVHEDQARAAGLREDGLGDVGVLGDAGHERQVAQGGQVGVLPVLLAGGGEIKAVQRRLGLGAQGLPALGPGTREDARGEGRGFQCHHHALPAGASSLSQS